jgi:hypothetical protein
MAKMSFTTLELFGQFTAAWSRGETPDPRVFLEPASATEREALSASIDGFLAEQPARPATNHTLGYVREIATIVEPEIRAEELRLAEMESELVQARVRLGKTQETLARDLCAALDLASTDEAKVVRYYHLLEVGQLDPRRVSPKVWAALRSILDRHAEPEMALRFLKWSGGEQGGGVVRPPRLDRVDKLFLGLGQK